MESFLKQFAELRDKANEFLEKEITKERFLLEGIESDDGYTDEDGDFLDEFYELPTLYVANKHGMLYSTKVVSLFRDKDDVLFFKSVDVETNDEHKTSLDDSDWSTIIEVAEYFLPE